VPPTDRDDSYHDVQIRDDTLGLPQELTLAVRRADAVAADRAGPDDGSRAPFLLVHGLASNARLWDGVARRLAAAGHDVVALDQRGHGRSATPTGGYDTATCAADLAQVCSILGWTGSRSPVLVGQSWGGNVVLTCAARHGAARALALVDGGWIALGREFATFEQCWARLAPPTFDEARYDDLAAKIRAAHPDWPDDGIAGTLANLRRTGGGGVRARLAREHHRQILHSLWAADPGARYPDLRVPVLALPAGSPDDAGERAVTKAAAVAELLAAVPGSRARWYPGADHDLHAQHPAAVAADLLTLAADPAPTRDITTRDGAR
jgi:pimeloyl-ACP methyl ester carboxylesterase